MKMAVFEAPLPPRGQEVVRAFICKHCYVLFAEIEKKSSIIQVVQ